MFRLFLNPKCLHQAQSFSSYATHDASTSWTTARLRTTFMDFFASKSHNPTPSASLIPPPSDSSILFTTAGMVPFKPHFLQPPTHGPTRACSVQRCLRAGGKHNDIEDVGLTARHLTFFEMLGNFSFGDYGKHDAISWAWELLTDPAKGLGLDPSRLRVTSHHSDLDTARIWQQLYGIATIPLDRDNWWALRDDLPGLPAGYCTEIFYDTGVVGNPLVDQWVEVWNLVFMQFQTTDRPGVFHQLPFTSVDTGMGLERLAAVMQRKFSNFEIDVMAPLVAIPWRFSGRDPARYAAFDNASLSCVAARIMADHLRASCFLVADGVLPSGTERGYVLRRLLRRAFSVGSVHLGLEGRLMGEMLAEFVEQLLALMGHAHPQLAQHQKRVAQVLQGELRSFQEVAKHGSAQLEDRLRGLRQAGGSEIPAEVAFQLHDAMGFPLDMTRAIAAQRGFSLDVEEVDRLMEEQRARGRASLKSSGNLLNAERCDSASGVPQAVVQTLSSEDVGNSFSGYDVDARGVSDARMIRAFRHAQGPDHFWVAVDPCPFYPRGGGQMGDRGRLQVRNERGQSFEFEVLDTIRATQDAIVLHVHLNHSNHMNHLNERNNLNDINNQNDLNNQNVITSDSSNMDLTIESEFPVYSTPVVCQLDMPFRDGSSRHHTATHLLHAALTDVLGEDIQQAGSAVYPDKLRFDFSFHRSLTAAELVQVESLINDWIRNDYVVTPRTTSLSEALEMGAACLPGESYQEVVRVVQVGEEKRVSMELCGGTHVDKTSKLGLLKILSESSTAAGIRRIEAVTGDFAIGWYKEQVGILQSLMGLLNISSPYGLRAEVERLMADKTELARQLMLMTIQVTETTSQTPLHSIECANGAIVVYLFDFDADLFPPKVLRKHAERMLPRRSNEVNLLLSGQHFVCLVNPSDHLLTTTQFLQALLPLVQGVGGGGPHIAQGKILDVKNLPQIIKDLPITI